MRLALTRGECQRGAYGGAFIRRQGEFGGIFCLGPIRDQGCKTGNRPKLIRAACQFAVKGDECLTVPGPCQMQRIGKIHAPLAPFECLGNFQWFFQSDPGQARNFDQALHNFFGTVFYNRNARPTRTQEITVDPTKILPSPNRCLAAWNCSSSSPVSNRTRMLVSTARTSSGFCGDSCVHFFRATAAARPTLTIRQPARVSSAEKSVRP